AYSALEHRGSPEWRASKVSSSGILLDLGLKCCILPTQRLMALPLQGGDESHHDDARPLLIFPVAFQPNSKRTGLANTTPPDGTGTAGERSRSLTSASGRRSYTEGG